MKRRKRLKILFFLVTALVMSSFAFSYALPQDINGHWAEDKIQYYLDKGIVTGYEDGSFRPDNCVTRAEFITIINKYFALTLTTDISFTDVPSNAWYRSQVQIAAKEGYITGYSDNSFKPDAFLTRQEAATVIAKLLDLANSTDTADVEKFNDGKEIPSWSAGYINSLIKESIMKGYPDNTIGYERYITRAEVLALLDNVKKYADSKTAEISFSSISISNGTIKLNPIQKIDGLTLDDFDVSASLDGKSYNLKNLKFNASNGTFSFEAISRTKNVQTLKITLKADSDKISGSASATIEIPKASSGGSSSGSSPSDNTNTAPTIPVITKSPSGNVSPTDPVTITAASTDAEGDAITYVWEGRLAETSTYPLGKQVITVKAVDEHGLESQQAALVFFVMDSATGNGGVLLTTPNSRIYENGIDGATITKYTFNVPMVSGHYGNDYATVKGLNVNTQQWDELIPDGQLSSPVYTSNGIYLEGSLTPGTYSRLEFFYYASHCMYGKSNITYTVEYTFGGIAPGVPAEAAPTASNVTVSGTPTVGSTLTGDYDYADINGDLEGYVDSQYDVISKSEYQWYYADDASGTNRTAITGGTNLIYQISDDVVGKYLTFEVTPLAVTGVTGTIEGAPVESAPVFITSTDTDILTFTIPEQTSAGANIDLVNHTISLEVVSGTDLTNLTPTITLSPGATVNPASLDSQDFTNPVTYTVTAADQVTTQNWVITVTLSSI